jgi:D-glycero-D-manno-heptose 1,7-bisphosphate phosphatase
VGRGTQRREVVEEINHHLLTSLQLDGFEVCYDASDGGPRRKPEPGMLLDAASALRIDVSRSFMVGDRWRDIEAGRRAGCTPIFIDLGYREAWPVASAEHVVYSLGQAAKLIASLDAA